ncbi:Diphthamide biosynthesis protein 3 [Tulasnella sp. 418]|nr:Diphthamide biosynthesis protein 3 [Tulasnella sp. 418]
MGGYYDEIEIEDMTFDPVKKVYHYPCPCGDRFEISKQQLRDYEDIATCPSCSLIIRVIYDPLDFEDEEDEDEDDGEAAENDDDEEATDEDDAEDFKSVDSGNDERVEEALKKLDLNNEGKHEDDGGVQGIGVLDMEKPGIVTG